MAKKPLDPSEVLNSFTPPKNPLQDFLSNLPNNQKSNNTPSGAGINANLNDFNLNSNDWRNVLGSLGTGSDFSQLLAELGIGNIDMSKAQMGDWNSELLKQILQYYITSEQRQYDKALQTDQRTKRTNSASDIMNRTEKRIYHRCLCLSIIQMRLRFRNKSSFITSNTIRNLSTRARTGTT